MSPRLEVPPSVDIAKLGSNLAGTWHIVDERTPSKAGFLDLGSGEINMGDATVRALCGREGPEKALVEDLDARVTNHKGAAVCSDCRTTYDAGGRPQKARKNTMTDVQPDPKVKTPARKATGSRKAKTTTRATTKARGVGSTSVVPVTAADLKAHTARAEKAIGTQPARSRDGLTQKQADDAFRLGKQIADARWKLKNAKAGKTDTKTVKALADRVVKWVGERNKIRAEKKA